MAELVNKSNKLESNIARTTFVHIPPTLIEPEIATSTSWLNGLRGLAALYLTGMHFLLAFLRPQWASQSPLLIFFVIGGYVSARKPLLLMQSARDGNQSAHRVLLRSLSLSTWRRGTRLFAPVFAQMLLTAVLSNVGAFGPLQRHFTPKDLARSSFPGVSPPLPIRRFKGALDTQLWYCLLDMSRMLNVWDSRQYNPVHGSTLWTIREEFRSSMQLYITLLACISLRPLAILSVLLVLTQFHMACGRWEVMLYFLGAAVAQLELMTGQVFVGRKRSWRIVISTLAQCLWLYLIYLSGILMLYPPPGADATAYMHSHPLMQRLEKSIPANSSFRAFWNNRDKIFNGLGCALFLIAWLISPRIGEPLRELRGLLFDNAFAQYLGHVSFGTLIVQGAILQAGGYLVPHLVWGWLNVTSAKGSLLGNLIASTSPEMQTVFGLGIGLVTNMVVAVIAGDAFTRTVIKGAQWASMGLERVVSVS